MKKNRFFTVAVMCSLLGLYAGAIYSFSQPVPVLNVDVNNAQRNHDQAAERILEVVRVQDGISNTSNIPLPGVDCTLTSEDIDEAGDIHTTSTSCFTDLMH